MSKIQALQCKWLTSEFSTKVLPLLYENGIEVVREEELTLTKVFDEAYRAKMLTTQPTLSRLDHRHWYYDDEVFVNYIHTVSAFNLPAVCLFDSPFGYELPNADIHVFEKKLYERTELAYQILKTNSPTTTVVSPAICIIDPEHQERYLDYFIHNRSFFDVYGLHCIYDMKEQTTGLLTALLTQVLGALRKPVWVTRWAVPSCEHRVENPFAILASNWTPMNHNAGAAALRAGFRAIEDLCKETRWFFAGLGKDDYGAEKDVPSMWDNSMYPMPETEIRAWDFYHFLGALTYQNQIKQPILDAFFEIAKKHNE
jgi:hypothetical protein